MSDEAGLRAELTVRMRGGRSAITVPAEFGLRSGDRVLISIKRSGDDPSKAVALQRTLRRSGRSSTYVTLDERFASGDRVEAEFTLLPWFEGGEEEWRRPRRS